MLYIAILTEIKTSLELEGDQDDALLEQMATGLQTRFDSSLNRTLLRAESATEKFYGNEFSLYVKRYPVETLVSVAYNGEEVDANCYRLREEEGCLEFLYGRWPDGKITVTYAGGYRACYATGDGEPMPADIRRAFFMQIGFEFRNRDSLGVSSVQANGVAKQTGAGVMLTINGITLLPEVEMTIQPYRRYA